MKKINSIITVCALILSLLLFEGVLRLGSISSQTSDRYIYQHSLFPSIPYEFKSSLNQPISGGGVMKTNAQGLREEGDFSLKDHTHQLIATFLGDSVTADINLPVDELYTKVFEKSVNFSFPSKVVSVNFGVNGYATKDEVEVLKYKVLPYKPDYIFIGYVLNDPRTCESPANAFVKENTLNDYCIAPVFNFAIPCALKHIASHFLSVKFIYSRLTQAYKNYKYETQEDYYTMLHNSQADFITVQKSFEQLAELAKKHAFKIYLIIFPLLQFDEHSYHWESIHKKVSAEATKRNITVIDLLDNFRKIGIASLRYKDNDIIHFNKIGHSAAGAAIAEKFIQYEKNRLKQN